MASETPAPRAPPETAAQPGVRTTSRAPVGTLSSCHYPSTPRSRKIVAVSALLSAALHAGLFFGHLPAKKKPAAGKEIPTIALTIVMPDVKDLEDPEPATKEVNDSGLSADLAPSVPSQAELLRAPQLGDFVQQIDFDALIDRSSLGQDKMWVIPDNIRHSGGIRNIGDIFNLADLERAPEPLLQPPPVYPNAMKREGMNASVNVEFVVDIKGVVVNATVVESSHSGFNDAAVSGVMKWKFRPGMRGGRKVNTRMRVPIVFHFAASEN